MTTHYDVLGVAAGADASEIRAAYARQAKRLHPDAGGDSARFRRLSAAYETLRNTPKRQAYNLLIEAKAREGSSRSTGPHVWLNISAAGLFAVLAAVAFVEGDGGGRYNGWLVGLGWALAIIAWRAFAERRRGFRNPLASLFDGVLIVALSAALFAWRLTMLMAMLFAGLGLLAAVEWLIQHA